MKILALETSAKAVSAAVSENGRILASGYQDTGLTHSRTLMPIVEHILKNTDLKLSDMDAIAENIAPLVGDAEGIGIAVVNGSPHDSITAYADEGGYDCIVMGHRGLGAVRGMLGSVCYSVLHKTNVPVLIVK